MIPALEELKTVDHWVAWRYELVDGRRTKVPYVANNGHKADATKPTDWRPFNVAASAYQKAGHEGIGLAVTVDDPYVGIDLDHCRDPETGAIEGWAQAIVDRLNSYTEITPSQAGLRVWIKGKKPGRHCEKAMGEGGRELGIYERKRFLTVTGNHVVGTPAEIHDRQDQLHAIYAELWPEPAAPNSIPTATAPLTDAEILDRARKAANGATTTALLAGDTSGYFSNHSRADQALVSRLAFWTQDRQQLDRLFRGSGLYREKWERQDYRDRTFDKALTTITDTYSVPTGKIVHNGSTTVASTDGDPDDVGDSDPRTDIRNGERFVKQHGREVRYNADSKRWLTWAGDRWRDNAQVEIEAKAKLTGLSVYDETKAANDPKLATWARHSQSTAGISGMLFMAHSEPAVVVRTADLDTHPMLLNTPSGTVDLTTGELRPARREDLITRTTAAPFDPGAECPRWIQFLGEIFVRGDFTPDLDLIGYIHRLIGYSLTGCVSEEMFAIFWGGGRNGKTVLQNSVRSVMGEYAGTTGSELLLSKPTAQHPTGMANLCGYRIIQATETDAGRRLDEATVKNITGSDPITARYMYGEQFTFDPSHKLFLATNHKPDIRGTDEGIWRRIHCVPFNKTIALGDVDRDLEAKLRSEWPGILAWAVRGCLDWQAGGLRPPAAVVETTQAYRQESDAIRRFVEDCCECIGPAQVRAGALFDAYHRWAEHEGEQPLTSTAFGRDMTSRGFPEARTTLAGITARVRRGIRLIAEA